MYTIGTTTAKKLVRVNSQVIALSAVAGEDLEQFAAVRLTNTGTVVTMSAADQLCFGIVEAAAKSGKDVTVTTPFSHIMKAKAAATVAIADKLQITDFNTTDKLNEVTPVSSAGKPVHAIALTAGSSGDEVTIGFLQHPEIY